MSWEYVPMEDLDAQGAVLVVGFPSVGMVGAVAGGFLAEHLGMRLAGTVVGEGLPPVGIVRKGRLTSPIQMWAKEAPCGLDHTSERLLLLRSDIAIPEGETVPLAAMVARWAREHGVALVVGVEGYVPRENVPNQGILGAASLQGAKVLDRLKVRPFDDAALTGFQAALLVRANRERIPAVALFAPVESHDGDASAAAEFVRLVDPLVPRIELKPDELLKRAEAIEARIQEEQVSQAAAMRKMREIDIGYA